jgi:hypothetical protein
MDLARVTSIESSLAISRQSFHFYLGPKYHFVDIPLCQNDAITRIRDSSRGYRDSNRQLMTDPRAEKRLIYLLASSERSALPRYLFDDNRKEGRKRRLPGCTSIIYKPPIDFRYQWSITLVQNCVIRLSTARFKNRDYYLFCTIYNNDFHVLKLRSHVECNDISFKAMTQIVSSLMRPPARNFSRNRSSKTR